VSDCELWTGRFTDQGYPLEFVGRRPGTTNRYRIAHRALWERRHGPVPEGMVVRRTCDNRACVAIEHQYLATIAERQARPIEGRMAKYVERRAPDECWPWRGTMKNEGYGVVSVDGRQHHAHRVAYQLAHPNENIDGLHVDHLCRNRRCCNPAHLEAVTPRVNVLRGISLLADNARKTECKRGHPFTPENTYVTTRGERRCRVCKRTDHKLWRQRRAERVAA
jgi:hypothetical protein